MKTILKSKKPCVPVRERAKQAGLSPLLAHLVACRIKEENIDFQKILHPQGQDIPHPNLLKNMERASERIAKAIIGKEAIVSFGDYDCDGQTGNSVIAKSMQDLFGVDSLRYRPLVGNRLTEGYGLTQSMCNHILSMHSLPDLVITTDCGSSDGKQIAQLKEKGIDVIVTDHHEIPKEGVPVSAYTTINPMQDGCKYPDKSIAGCMVAWLTMCAVKIKLAEQGYFDSAPNLTSLLDFVALGTIADAVSLFSPVNRYVINAGLKIINSRQRHPWIAAVNLVDQEYKHGLTVQDIAFQLAPRINARSRMDDPYAALYYLLAETETTATEYLAVLDQDNTRRKEVEKEMKEEAFRQVEEHWSEFHHSIVVFDESFHAGVQGIIASRLTEKYGVPTIVFSPTSVEGVLSGSARTIEEVHIRKVLQNISDTDPDIILQFGGHKGAAGLKIAMDNIWEFRILFNRAIQTIVGTETELLPTIAIDASLAEKGLIHMGSYEDLQKLQPFGNGFEEPVFADNFTVQGVKMIGATKVHASLSLKDMMGRSHKGVWFWAVDTPEDKSPVTPGDNIRCAYRLNKNIFRGTESLQLMVHCIST